MCMYTNPDYLNKFHETNLHVIRNTYEVVNDRVYVSDTKYSKFSEVPNIGTDF